MTESQMQRLVKSHILSASMGITETNLKVRGLVRILTHNLAMVETFPRILHKFHTVAETVNIRILDAFQNNIFQNDVFQSLAEDP